MGEDFEWDYRKAAGKLAKHGVSVDAAREVFKDPFAIEWLDESENYGEDRFVIIGGRKPLAGCRFHNEGVWLFG